MKEKILFYVESSCYIGLSIFSMRKDDSYVEKQGLEAQLREVESMKRKLDEDRKRIVNQLDAVNKRIAKKQEFQQAVDGLSGVRGTNLVKGIHNLIFDSEK